ncbi:MAG: OmpA family protein [Acidimicrobiia bacterium]|nr:OmpA family protein [Acidimicrobiia bacterium]
MPSLLETVTALLKQGANLDELGALLNTERERASALVDLATPVAIAGLANRAVEPGGADIVIRLLDGVDASIVGSPLIFIERGDPAIGEGLLHSIFADEHTAVTRELAEWGNAPLEVINRLLPGILALAICALGRRRAVRGVDDAGVLALLDKERSSLAGFRLRDAGEPDVGEVDGGGDRNRVPAMAGATATVDTMAVSGITTETTGAASRLAGPDADAAVETDVETDVESDVDVDGGSDRASTDGQWDPVSDDRDGPGLLWLVAGGLAAIVLLAWALSQLVGGGSGEADDRIDDAAETTDDAAVEPPDLEPASAENVDGGNEDATNVGDGRRAEGATDLTGGTTPIAEPAEPTTINEQLSLDPITFEVRSATITAEGLAVLDQAAAYLKADPEVTVEIAGHTDSDGDAEDNMRLSQDRADVVKDYLESQGIDGARMTSIGYGENDPVASNNTEVGKARNRRIEFVIQ